MGLGVALATMSTPTSGVQHIDLHRWVPGLASDLLTHMCLFLSSPVGWAMSPTICWVSREWQQPPDPWQFFLTTPKKCCLVGAGKLTQWYYEGDMFSGHQLIHHE